MRVSRYTNFYEALDYSGGLTDHWMANKNFLYSPSIILFAGNYGVKL